MFPVRIFLTIVGEGEKEIGYHKELNLPIPPFIGLKFNSEVGGLPFEIRVEDVEIGLEDSKVSLWATGRQELPDSRGKSFFDNAIRYFDSHGWTKL